MITGHNPIRGLSYSTGFDDEKEKKSLFSLRLPSREEDMAALSGWVFRFDNYMWMNSWNGWIDGG